MESGTGYCGKVESHDYPLYIATSYIEQAKTKVRSAQTHGNTPWHLSTVL